MVKEIKDMTNDQLVKALELIQQQIETGTYSAKNCNFREAIYMEISKRKLKVQKTTSFKLVK